MIYFAAFIIAGFLAILHVSAMQYVEVLGVTPDLLLVFAACFAVLRKEGESMLMVPIAGLFRDLTASDPIGTAVLGFAPIVLIAAATRMRSTDAQFIPAAVVSLTGTVSYVAISMGVLALSGQAIDISHALLRVAIPLAVVNALFTPTLYMPMSWFRSQEEPRVLGSRRITIPF